MALVLGAASALTMGLQPVHAASGCQVWTDAKGDALYPPQAGSNETAMDLTAGALTVAGSNLQVLITVNNYHDPSLTSADSSGAKKVRWVMWWTFNNAKYWAAYDFAQNTSTTGAISGSAIVTTKSYGDGQGLDAQGMPSGNPVHTQDAGSVTEGAGGTVEIDVPLANVGNPAPGDTLSTPTGYTIVYDSAISTEPVQIDQGNTGQTDYQVGQACSSSAATSSASSTPTPTPTSNPTPTSTSTDTSSATSTDSSTTSSSTAEVSAAATTSSSTSTPDVAVLAQTGGGHPGLVSESPLAFCGVLGAGTGLAGGLGALALRRRRRASHARAKL